MKYGIHAFYYRDWGSILSHFSKWQIVRLRAKSFDFLVTFWVDRRMGSYKCVY